MSDNKGTPMSILEAANNCIAINWEQPPRGITIDKEVNNSDGTKTIYFTSYCDLKPADKGMQVGRELAVLGASVGLVPRVAQHDIDTCCGTTANNVKNLAYVNQLEAKCKLMDSILSAHKVDTLYQLMRYIGKLESRCQVLTQQVNQLKIREQELLDQNVQLKSDLVDLDKEYEDAVNELSN